jgi:hypothetical protein
MAIEAKTKTTNEGEKIMKKRLSTFVAALILVAAASLAFASFGRTSQKQQKQFALLMKATGPEFFICRSWLAPALLIEHLSHFRYEPLRGERFFNEVRTRIEDALPHDRIIGIS